MSKVDMTHIRAVLFDLDGTLLEVEMGRFIPRYIANLAAVFSDLVSPKKFRKKFHAAMHNLIFGQANGATNEERLLTALEQDLAIPAEEFRLRLNRFAEQSAESFAEMVSAVPAAREAVDVCRVRGHKLVLATNPVFPRFMIDARMRWSGLSKGSFDHVTSYENSRYCKPSLAYFEDVVAMIGVPAEQCLMIGNDSSHDLAAMGVGMKTYLVDTYLVERPGRRWPSDFRGNHQQLLAFLREHLPDCRTENGMELSASGG